MYRTMSLFRIASVSLVFISFVLESNTSPIVTITRTNDDAISLDVPPSEEAVVKETISQYISSVLQPVFDKWLILFFHQIMSMMIAIEIVTISTGNHFGMIVPQVDSEADLELHRKAMAITELWQQLPTAENIESAAQQAALEVGELIGHAILKDVPVQGDVVQKMMQLVLEKIEDRLKEDPNTFKGYTEAKLKFDKQFAKLENHRIFFATNKKITLKTEKEILRQWFSNFRVRTFFIYRLFAKQCLKRVPRPEDTDYENIVLAKAITRLAKIHNKTDDVNRIYQGIVSELAEEFNFEKYKLHASLAFGGFNPVAFENETTPVLFKKMKDKLKENTTLYTELLAQKKGVIGDALLEDLHPIDTALW